MVESSSEDFRSVIDDLTIENRRLKKRLQKYEELYCGNLQSDKLFEIRVHGLPASKKRRLERTLQDFASSLGDTGDEEFSSAFAQKLYRAPKRRFAPVPQALSTSTSNSRPVDSAYVSMSASGGNTDSRLQKIDLGKTMTPSNSNDQNIQSYLQTISQGLLPKHPPVMTEKAKKEIVVKRLEQLFTGSRDSSNKHSQSRQQQEVSQSAANADRRESEARGHHIGAEGSREAKIHLSESQATNHLVVSAVERPSDDASSRGTSASSVATPDQRPTRPLDLDPSRAQDPEENIEYIKHLGFDGPEMVPERSFGEEEGWVYLNLLIGMAQLHILNVTPTFVRESIRDISVKFELSEDGSRIRWRGGNEGTKLRVDSGPSSEHGTEPYPSELGVTREHSNGRSSKSSTELQSSANWNVILSHNPSPGSYNTTFDNQRPLMLGRTNSEDPYQYRPIFYHAPRSEEDSCPSEGKDSPLFSDPMENGSALGPDDALRGHAPKVAASRLRKGADPIIFYNRARFYTDLSKDEESMPYNCPLYDKYYAGIVGCDIEQDLDDPHAEGKGLICETLGLASIAAMELSNSAKLITGLTESLSSSSAAASLSSEDNTKPFEASGLGGVIPGDNFSIKVKIEHQKQTSEQPLFQRRILSVHRTDLLPSSLPPPSYAFLPLSSGSASDGGSANDEESDADMEDAGGEEHEVGRFAAPRLLDVFSSGTMRSESSDDQDSDDSSIDLLAHARQLEPEEVAAREREFEDISKSSVEMEVMEVDPADSSVVATIGEQS